MPTTNPHTVTQEQISERARRYYEEAGSPEGRDEEFWLRAEQDLQNENNGERSNGERSSSKQTQKQTETTIKRKG